MPDLTVLRQANLAYKIDFTIAEINARIMFLENLRVPPTNDSGYCLGQIGANFKTNGNVLGKMLNQLGNDDLPLSKNRGKITTREALIRLRKIHPNRLNNNS